MVIFLLSLLFSQAYSAPLSPTAYQQVTAEAYKKLSSVVAIDKRVFDDTLSEALRQADIYPTAISIGVMGKCQNIIGICVGNQINIGVQDGKLMASSYGLAGLSLGTAEIYKIEVYVALCFGDCLSTLGEGFYFGGEAGFAVGTGGSVFIEVGTDVSEVFGVGRDFAWKDFWDYKTVYIGIAYNFGLGIGIAGDIYYYRLMWSKEIALEDIKNLDL